MVVSLWLELERSVFILHPMWISDSLRHCGFDSSGRFSERFQAIEREEEDEVRSEGVANGESVGACGGST